MLLQIYAVWEYMVFVTVNINTYIDSTTNTECIAVACRTYTRLYAAYNGHVAFRGVCNIACNKIHIA